MTPRQRWYAKNREAVLAAQSAKWYARHPRTKTKACGRCGEAFTYQVTKGCNARAFCPSCRVAADRERKAAYKLRHREKVLEAERLRQRRKMEQPGERERAAESARRWRQQNPERVKEIRRAFYQRHAERKRAEKRERTLRNRMAIYERDQGICHICGEHVPVGEFEVDHVLPVSRGGTSEKTNLATSHFRCNRRKAARLLEEMV